MSIQGEWVGLGAPGNCPAAVKVNDFAQTYVTDTVTLGKSPDNWREILATAGNAGSQLSGVRYYCVQKGFTYAYGRFSGKYPAANKCQRGASSGAMGIPALRPLRTQLNADADAAARSKFLSKALSARKAWRGGNTLAEFAETVHMLRHPLTGLYNSVSEFAYWVRRLKARQYAKNLGDLWLQYSFGWSPLFEDIKDINHSLEKWADGTYADTKYISATGKSEESTPMSAFNTAGLGTGLAQFMGNRTWTKDTSTVRYYGALKARPECIATIADNFGFSATDILPAIWEAIPWSFFVDYFLNVQEAIDSMQFAASDFGWMMRGIRNTNSSYRSALATNEGAAVSAQFDVTGGGGSGISATIYKQRDPYYTFPYPRFHFRVPGLGSLKWFNVGALAALITASRPTFDVKEWQRDFPRSRRR